MVSLRDFPENSKDIAWVGDPPTPAGLWEDHSRPQGGSTVLQELCLGEQ